MKKFAFALLILLGFCLSLTAIAQVMSAPDIGITADLPDDIDEYGVFFMETEDSPSCTELALIYLNQDALIPYRKAYEAALESGDQEAASAAYAAYTDQFYQRYQPFYTILCIDTDETDAYAERLKDATLIGVNSTRSYYYMPGEPNDALAESEKTPVEAARPVADRIIAGITVIEIEKDGLQAGDSGLLSGLDTIDMDGNAVNASIFAGADLTVMNIWQTSCNPCIAEMPELAAWADELPQNVQLIGLIADVYDVSDKTYARAEKILSKAGVGFVNLLNNDSLSPLLSGVAATPTTLFFDSEGKIVAEPVVGAYIDAYKQVVAEFLEK